MSLLQKLKSYYRINGISPFHCPHQKECKGESQDFIGPKAALIGKYYENFIPKLLFMSLDPGKERRWSRYRTIQSVRSKQAIFNGKDTHWWETCKLAFDILSRFNNELSKNDKFTNYFAHTNSAKCCLNRTPKAPLRLFTNCREYISGEIEILNPDIIITQGKEAKLAVDYCIENNSFKHIGNSILKRKATRIPRNIKFISVNGKSVIWIHTHHPRHGDYYNEIKRFDDWFKVIEHYLSINNIASRHPRGNQN